MPQTSAAPAPSRHRNIRRKPELSQSARGVLRAALLRVVGALASRPEPRDCWDDLGRDDAVFRARQIVDRDVEWCRHALGAAEQEGPAVLGHTLDAVDLYFAAKWEAARAGFQVPRPNSLADAVVAMTKDGAELMVSGAEVQRDATEGNFERLRWDAMAAIQSGEHVLETTDALLNQVHAPMARAAR